jgi:hypothetical protein
MKPSPPSPSKLPRRLLLLALLVALLAGGTVLFGRWFPRAADPAEKISTTPPDAEEEKAWRKANPWLYSRAEYEPFRDALILPLARAGALGPRGVKKRGALVEVSFPAGRPIHEYAHDLESLCARAGIVVIEGRETGTDQVEYRLADAQGRPLALRLVLGNNALPGSVRMALVITGLGNASEADLQAWLKFKEAVTLVLPDTAAVLASLKAQEADPRPEIFVELPMEPSTYP